MAVGTGIPPPFLAAVRRGGFTVPPRPRALRAGARAGVAHHLADTPVPGQPLRRLDQRREILVRRIVRIRDLPRGQAGNGERPVPQGLSAFGQVVRLRGPDQNLEQPLQDGDPSAREDGPPDLVEGQPHGGVEAVVPDLEQDHRTACLPFPESPGQGLLARGDEDGLHPVHRLHDGGLVVDPWREHLESCVRELPDAEHEVPPEGALPSEVGRPMHSLSGLGTQASLRRGPDHRYGKPGDSPRGRTQRFGSRISISSGRGLP